MTIKQENAVINLVDRFLASKVFKKMYSMYLDKEYLKNRLEVVMKDSILGRNKEIMKFAITTMIEKVDAL